MLSYSEMATNATFLQEKSHALAQHNGHSG